MIRSALALITLALLGTVATAQPRAVPVPVRVPQPLPLPLSPGVMPGSTIGPGMQYVPQRTTTFPRRYNTVVVPTIMPWGWGMGWGVPAYSPLVGGFGYPYGYGGYFPPAQNITVQQQVTNVGGGAQREQTIALAREYPATLTVQFPADAEVWLDGKKVSDGAGEVHVLKSPVLEQGDQYTFQVKGQWKSKGKTYEAKRSVTLGAGAKSRLLIVSGEEVKE